MILAVVIAMVIHRQDEAAEWTQLAQRSEPWWLLVAVAMQVLTYACAAECWRIPLWAAGHRVGRFRLFRLALLKLTADQAVPTAGVSGVLIVVQQLAGLGVPSDVLGAVLLVEYAGYTLAYAVSVFVSLALLWAVHGLDPTIAVGATVFATLTAALPLAILARLHRGPWDPPGWLKRIGPLESIAELASHASHSLAFRPDVLARATLAYFGVVFLDAATLAATLGAVGELPDLLTAFPAMVLGTVATSVSPAPGGLGPFEAGAVATLVSEGIGASPALAAVLLLRGFTFWLPMGPGLMVWLHERVQAERRQISAADD